MKRFLFFTVIFLYLVSANEAQCGAMNWSDSKSIAKQADMISKSVDENRYFDKIIDEFENLPAGNDEDDTASLQNEEDLNAYTDTIYSSEEVEAMIDQYERFANRIIEIFNKAGSGDSAAVEEMLEISNEMIEWSLIAQKMGPSLSPQQSDRLMKIAEKVLNLINEPAPEKQTKKPKRVKKKKK